MTDLVFVQGNQPVTTSLKVAEHFEKRHDRVIRDIRGLLEQMASQSQSSILGDGVTTPNFQMYVETSYQAEDGGRHYPMYLMNRDGFSLLAMGFTGEKALQFKLKFIAAFNAMEQQLKRQNERAKIPMPVADMVSEVGTVAENIQSVFTGVKRGIALSQAIDLVGSFKNFSLAGLKELLPPADHDTGYLNATQIGMKLGLGMGQTAARKANLLLKEAGLHYKDGEDWRLTDEGTAYGEELPYTKNGHSGYQIRWNSNVLDTLRGQ